MTKSDEEIEITPEMIEAGEHVYATREVGWLETRSEFVERLFRAMWAARITGSACRKSLE